MTRKIFISALTGLLIMVVTWKYQNYDFSFSVEDAFLKKIFFWKDKIYSSPPREKADFVFINTGKDLALVEDTVEYGNVSVSDRRKICQFMTFINSVEKKPAYTILDIQFYYPYTLDPGVDSMLGREIVKNAKVLVPVVKNADGTYKKPLYEATYGYSDYRTYGVEFNKFRIMNQESIPSIPVLIHQTVNRASYHDHFLYPTCDGKMCLSAIWPSYYLKSGDIENTRYGSDLQILESGQANTGTKPVRADYFNLGELLFDIEASPDNYTTYFENKIVMVGNFDQDIHSTPVGKMGGPLLLANIYLSLLNGQHIINIWFFIILLAALSAISYVALYRGVPELRFNFRFLFSSYLMNFLRKYISYFGSMFVLSLIILIIFDVQVALFLPSFIFTGIEYVRQKKYKVA